MLSNSDKHYLNMCSLLVLTSTAKTDAGWWIFMVMAMVSMGLYVRGDK